MKPGLFFKPESSTPTGSPLVLFSYKRLILQGVYPVYAALEASQVSFFFLSPTGKEHIRLFSLHYSDFSNPNGKLSRELEGLRKNPLRTLFTQTAQFNYTFDDIPSYSSAYLQILSSHPQWRFSVDMGHRVSSKGTQICLVTLLLDFLYDSKQSEVFSLSTHYGKWLQIIRENILLDAILTKVDFLYKRKLEEQIKGDPSSSEINLTSQTLKRSEEKWLERIISPTIGLAIANSDWFENNLEKECSYILYPNKRVSMTHPHALDMDIVSDTVEWLIMRFNYFAAGTLIMKTHPINQGVLILICSIPFQYIIAQLFNRSGHNEWLVAGGFFLSISLIMGLFFLAGKVMTPKDYSYRKTINLQAYNTVLYVSPHLIIAIFFAWWTVRKAIGKEFIPPEIINWTYVLVIILIPIFLFKIIKDQAPDLSLNAVSKRIGLLISRASLFIFIIGFTIFDILFYKRAPVEIGKTYEYDSPPLILCWDLVVNQFPIVFLSSVFIGWIFRGKIFTGWYPRSLGK